MYIFVILKKEIAKYRVQTLDIIKDYEKLWIVTLKRSEKSLVTMH